MPQHKRLAAKATNDLYSPLTGAVVEVNSDLEAEPSLVNQDPYGKGWMITVELGNPSELDSLMSAEEYQALVSGDSLKSRATITVK